MKERLWTGSFAVMLVATFMSNAYNVGQNAALPVFADSIGETSLYSGTLVALFAVSAAVSRVISGDWIDRFNNFLLGALGIVCMVVASLPFFWSQSLLILSAARVVQGAGYSIFTTTLAVQISRRLPAKRLGEGLGYRGLAVALSLSFSSVLMLAVLGWSGQVGMTLLILGFCALCALALPLFSHTAGDARDAAAAENPDGENSGMLQPTDRLRGIRRLIEFRSLPFSALEFLRRVTTGAIFSYVALYALSCGLPDANAFFIVSSLTIFAARLFGGRLLNDASPRRLLVPLFAVSAFGFAWLLLAPSLASLIGSGVCYGITEGFASPFLNSNVLKRANKERWGIATGNFYLAGDMGMALGSFAAGGLAGLFGYSAIVVLSVAFSLIGVMGALRLKEGVVK